MLTSSRRSLAEVVLSPREEHATGVMETQALLAHWRETFTPLVAQQRERVSAVKDKLRSEATGSLADLADSADEESLLSTVSQSPSTERHLSSRRIPFTSIVWTTFAPSFPPSNHIYSRGFKRFTFKCLRSWTRRRRLWS